MKIFSHSAGREHPEIVEIEATALVRELLVTRDTEEAVWVEEVEEPLDLEVTLEAAGIGHHHHVHRGRCRRVEVVVRYGGESYEDSFGPARTIRRVKRWAVGPKAADLSREEAAKHVLAMPGADHFLEDGVHIGSLVGEKSCTVTLDLMPRSRFEG
jgi:hypothetical protein